MGCWMRVDWKLVGLRRVMGVPSQKVQKREKWLLTVRGGGDYIRLTNEGGAPLAAKKFALVTEIQRAA